MNSLNILHISDSHIQKRDEEEIKEIVCKLIDDVKKVQVEEQIGIDLICFTGDLIQRGDRAIQEEDQMKIADKILVQPLLDELGLNKDSFLMVPGNHEVDINKIVKATEKGLLVNSLEEIHENLEEMDKSYLDRLGYFYDSLDTYYTEAIRGKIGYAFMYSINGKKVGIACIDSSWRSSGKGECEKGLMYVGEKQIQDLFRHIKCADIKICMMHHPIDWLSPYESTLIEREMTKFDLVLCGHVHENDNKEICRQDMKTIYSTAGKLFPLDYAQGRKVDGYNGYSILNIDYNTNLCTIFMRTYFAKERNDFDKAVNVKEDGKTVYPLNGNTNEKQMEFNIITGINEYFKGMSETINQINEIDVQSPINIEQVFVEPILSEESEYRQKNNKDKKKISMNELIDIDKNIILLGKKESGKTTILQKMGLLYIEKYRNGEIIPIYLDMRHLPKGKNKLINATLYFVMNNVFDDVYISKAQVKELIDNGKFVFLFDNVDISDRNHTIMINEFLKNNSNNKFYFTVNEEFFQSIDIKKIPEYGESFKKLYIHSFGKGEIRELVTKWACKQVKTIDVNEVVEKINSYCNQINFAKTPFNISIFMVIWDIDKNFVPQNEGIVMENYLEVLLEKLSPIESNRSTYSFQIKQHFLSSVAYKMFEKNEYYFTKKEFDDYVYEYHEKKGYKETESRFSELFFEKGILSKSDGLIVFSHTSILEYFLAIYAKENDEFLKYMLEKHNRINFKNEICFYAGLTPDCANLLDSIADTIIETIIDSIDTVEKLNNLEIMMDFKFQKEELLERLKNNRPNQGEVDKLSDISNPQKEKSPLQIDKQKNNLIIESPKIIDIENENVDELNSQDTEDFYSLVQIYGSVLKNAELLDNEYKINHLENYMYAMNILLGEILHVVNIIRGELLFEDFVEELEEEKKKPTEEEFEEIKNSFTEMMKITFPIILQQIIVENIGTPKLERAIEELMKNKTEEAFEKFMLVFLKCDLRSGNVVNELKKYIEEENSENILKLIFTKLVFYYNTRYFGADLKMDNNIIDLIACVQMKLSGSDDKLSQKVFEGNKAFVRKRIIQQIKGEEALAF